MAGAVTFEPAGPRECLGIMSTGRMALKSKLLPVVALGVAIAFSWCYALAGPAYPATDAAQPAQRSSSPIGLAAIETTVVVSFCDSCFSFAATAAKMEHPTGAPPGDGATPVTALIFPPAPSALVAYQHAPSGGLALHRTSLFHQATLIRI